MSLTTGRCGRRDSGSELQKAFKSVDNALGNANIDLNQSGSTLTTCARKGDKLFVANVGDSRIVLGRDKGVGAILEPVHLDMDAIITAL